MKNEMRFQTLIARDVPAELDRTFWPLRRNAPRSFVSAMRDAGGSGPVRQRRRPPRFS